MNTPSDWLDRRKTYKVCRYYAKHPTITLKTGLSEGEAKAHCNSPESIFTTAQGPEATKHTETFGAWFDGYVEE